MSFLDKLNNKGFKKYGANTFWLLIDKLLRLIVSVFIGVWLAKYLGPSKFGVLSYVQSFVMLLAPIASFGLDNILIRDLVKSNKNKEVLLFTCFLLKVLGSLVLFGLLFLIPKIVSNDLYVNCLISILGVGYLFQSFNVIEFYFQSKVDSKHIVFVKIIVLLLSGIIKVSLILNEAPLDYFIYLLVFDFVFLAIGYLYVGFSKGGIEFGFLKFNKNLAKKIFKESWPLILTSIVIAIYMRIDQIMIKELLGDIANGEYAAAVKLSEAWYFIPTIIASSLFPAIVNAKIRDEKLYESRLKKLYNLMVIMALSIAIPMTFLSEFIILNLYGQEYSNAVSVLKIHIWSGVFVFIGVVYGKFLVNENLTKKALYRTIFGVVINILLNLVLIPFYGINGAAMATLFAQFGANFLYDFFDKDLQSHLKLKVNSLFLINIFKKD